MRTQIIPISATESISVNPQTGGLQIVAACQKRWTDKTRLKFLDHLAATCNVKASAAAAERSPESAFKLRRRNPEFAEAWSAALATGYVRLEEMLINRAAAGGLTLPTGPEEEAEPVDISGVDTELALRLLAYHREGLKGVKRGGGPKPGKASEAETNGAILKKLKAMRIRFDGEEGSDAYEAQ